MDNIIEWCGYKWINRERWGRVHPDKKLCWYDPSCVEVVGEELKLSVKSNPYNYEGELVPYGIGLVSCTEEFGYGEFSADVIMPEGNKLWPAFWMWAWDSWPPEIDIFEGYSNKMGFFKFRLKNILGFWNIQTNVHYRDGYSNKMTRGKTHWFGFKNPSKNWINYRVIWESDKITFYYNNRKVRVVKDPDVIRDFAGKKMNVILNNSIIEGFKDSDLTGSALRIKNFKYTPL